MIFGIVSPTIHVISGTDWAAIWAAVATAIAAVVGVGGTAWQGARARRAASDDLKASLAAATANLVTSITAEDNRADIAAKRRIYAACLASLKLMIPAVIMHRGDMTRATTQEERLAARARMHDSRLQMLNAVSEIRLIADDEVTAAADEAERSFMSYLDETNRGGRPRARATKRATTNRKLTRLMRKALGVPDPPASLDTTDDGAQGDQNMPGAGPPDRPGSSADPQADLVRRPASERSPRRWSHWHRGR